jgi:hypothetical protein
MDLTHPTFPGLKPSNGMPQIMKSDAEYIQKSHGGQLCMPLREKRYRLMDGPLKSEVSGKLFILNDFEIRESSIIFNLQGIL